MRVWPLLAAIALSLTLAGITALAAPASGEDAQSRLIRARMAQWTAGYNQANVPAMLEVLADDYLEDSQIQAGSADKQEMSKTYSDLFAKYETHIDCVIDQAYTAGDRGFDRGHYTMTITSRRSGATTTQRGTYMEVWRRENGIWRVRQLTNLSRSGGPVALF